MNINSLTDGKWIHVSRFSVACLSRVWGERGCRLPCFNSCPWEYTFFCRMCLSVISNFARSTKNVTWFVSDFTSANIIENRDVNCEFVIEFFFCSPSDCIAVGWNWVLHLEMSRSGVTCYPGIVMNELFFLNYSDISIHTMINKVFTGGDKLIFHFVMLLLLSGFWGF